MKNSRLPFAPVTAQRQEGGGPVLQVGEDVNTQINPGGYTLLSTGVVRMHASESFKSKLYRYFFFGWLLKEPHGDVWLRHSLRTSNREALDRWLPHYVRVHALVSALLCGLLWAAMSLELSLWFVGPLACGMSVEMCLTLALVAAHLALRLQQWSGDIDNE